MTNGLKTALLLGLLSGLLLVIGELAGGANGLMIAFVLAAIMNFVSVLVLGQDGPADVPRAGGRAGASALSDH